MLAVEPEGPFSEAVAKIARMVTLSSRFQQQTNSVSDVEAEKHVHFKKAFAREEAKRPYAIVRLGQTFGYRKISGGASDVFVPFGTVDLHIEIDTPSEHWNSKLQAEMYAGNFFGVVMNEIVCLSGADDGADDSSHLVLQDVQSVDFGENPEDTWPTMGRFYRMLFQLTWGNFQ